MRSRFLSPLLLLVAVVAVGAIWLRERSVAAGLQRRGAALTEQEDALARLRKERERLGHEILEAMSESPDVPVAQAPPGVPAEPPPDQTTWTKGEWTPAAAWRNEGRATPQATTSTLLWAAANGDLSTLRRIFQFDEGSRAKAVAWFESLSPAARGIYATPEELVLSTTLARIAPDRAQVSWLHEAATDRAIVGMLLAQPTSVTTGPKAAADSRAPALEDRSSYKVVVLNLHRDAEGWRVAVPPTAIDALAKQLRAPEGK